MNIPNLLSLFRIILVPAVVILLIRGEYFDALICFGIAGITDALDRALARLWHQQTVLGAYLDPPPTRPCSPPASSPCRSST